MPSPPEDERWWFRRICGGGWVSSILELACATRLFETPQTQPKDWRESLAIRLVLE